MLLHATTPRRQPHPYSLPLPIPSLIHPSKQAKIPRGSRGLLVLLFLHRLPKERSLSPLSNIDTLVQGMLQTAPQSAVKSCCRREMRKGEEESRGEMEGGGNVFFFYVCVCVVVGFMAPECRRSQEPVMHLDDNDDPPSP